MDCRQVRDPDCLGAEICNNYYLQRIIIMNTSKPIESMTDTPKLAPAPQTGTPTSTPVETPTAEPATGDADKGISKPAESKDADVSSATPLTGSKH